jgi:hypothetical protein
MCTAALRPPVDETTTFLRAILKSHGDDFLVKIFGDAAKDDLKDMGGVDAVAVALSEQPTATDFGRSVGMNTNDVANMRKVLNAIAEGDTDGFKGSEASDFKFFAVKLMETGF